MHLWNVRFNPKSGRRLHEVAPGFGHALLAPLLSYVFKALRVSAAVWEHSDVWFPIHPEPSFLLFEQEHGKDVERSAYNMRLFQQVQKKKAMVRGEHGGYSDLFVPILVQGHVVGILVTGPFGTARPTAADVQEGWRWLTGRAAHATDAEFAAYVAAALGTLVLDREQIRAFERTLSALTGLMACRDDAAELANEIDRVRPLLEDVRQVERTWETVQAMVDERSSHAWFSPEAAYGLSTLGLPRVPDEVLVGLSVGSSDELGFIDLTISLDAFRRSAVELGRSIGGVIAGPVGSHGVAFLCVGSGSVERRQQRLRDLAERALGVARRRHGLALHFGACTAIRGASLSWTYQAALGAAESALIQGKRIVFADPVQSRPLYSLRQLRDDIARAVEERPDLLGSRFDRYLEAAALHSGNRVDLARVHLEVGFEQVAGVLVTSGMLEQKSFLGLCQSLHRATGEAKTMRELFAACRRAAADVSQAVERPVPARRDRNLRRALEHIRQHYTENLRFSDVARIAGFAPNYFSKLFKAREGVTFEHYVRALRLERSQHLLKSTDLEVTRVARLCGFNSLEYFVRAFRGQLGTTPQAFRLKEQRGRGRARN